MGKLLDMTGKVIDDTEDPPSLLEVVKEMPKEWRTCLERCMELVNLNYAGNLYLYSMPTEEEIYCEEMPRWEAYISAVNNQYLANPDDVEKCRWMRSDLEVGRKAIVVFGERPFYESVPTGKTVKKKGNSFGVVGKVKSFDVTNSHHSKLLSLNGLSYVRIELVEPAELSVEELVEWNGCMITYVHLGERSPLDSFYKKMNLKPTSTDSERLIYKPFFNLDYVAVS